MRTGGKSRLIYRRYSNFSIESIPAQFTGDVDFGKRCSCTIARNADLLWRTYLQVTLPALTGGIIHSGVRWVDKVGHALIQSYWIDIGGQRVDTQYGEWLEIWNSLTMPATKLHGYNKMIGHVTQLHTDATLSSYTLYIPLLFWFCQNIGLALPLVSLQNHNVTISVQLAPLSALIIQANPADVFTGSIVNACLYVDQIYCDIDERRRFATARQQMLITQLQIGSSQTLTIPTNNLPINLNHPCKCLIFVAQKAECVAANVNQQFNFTDTLQIRDTTALFDESIDNLDAGAIQIVNNVATVAHGPLVSCCLLLNSHQRFDTRTGSYFNYVQPFQHWSNVPSSPGIYAYSFAINPEAAQPSGSTNFSKIDQTVLQCTFSPSLFINAAGSTNQTAQFRLYALNLNILKVSDGRAGVALITLEYTSARAEKHHATQVCGKFVKAHTPVASKQKLARHLLDGNTLIALHTKSLLGNRWMIKKILERGKN